MEEELYDEFGNYIGPDLEDQEESEEDAQPDLESQLRQSNHEMEEDYFEKGQEVVLHEDKQYYPEAEKIYGQGVEALVEEEDHQPLTQPIIEPVRDKFNMIQR